MKRNNRQHKDCQALSTIQLHYFAEIAKGNKRHNLSNSAIPDSPATVTSPQERMYAPQSAL